MPRSAAKFCETARITRAASLIALIFLLFGRTPAGAQNKSGTANISTAGFTPVIGAIYESAFRDNTVEFFSPNGNRLGMIGRQSRPTGIAFDAAGNLFIVNDDIRAYAIMKVAASDGTVS